MSEITKPLALDETLQDVADAIRLERTSAEWGKITGDIEDQTDLKNELDNKASNADLQTEATARETADTALRTSINTEKSTRENADTTLQNNIDIEENARISADDELSEDIADEVSARQAAINQEANTRNSAIQQEAETRATADSNINSKIPAQATSSNQLADKAFVNSSIESVAAYYITKNASGDPFSTKAELDAATEFYSGGARRTPTRNDYCIVLADETHRSTETGQDPSCRYIYHNSWEFQYVINNNGMTAAQYAAINSGITQQKRISYDTHISDNTIHVTAAERTTWNAKQNALTEGTDYLTAAHVNSAIAAAIGTAIEEAY